MGKVGFTPFQELVFNELAKFAPLVKQLYLTGGTALSVFYLNHRYSEDLDFFSEQKLEDEVIADFMRKVTSLFNLKHRYTTIGGTRIFEFQKEGTLLLKIDFAYYPYPQLKKRKVYQGILIDSLLDIAANKLLLINQRSDIKDFVDLFFLLKKFTLWDLMYAVEKKFNRETDLLLLGADFLKIEEFEFLPKMAKPLDLEKLKEFFRRKAKEVGGRAVKRKS